MGQWTSGILQNQEKKSLQKGNICVEKPSWRPFLHCFFFLHCFLVCIAEPIRKVLRQRCFSKMECFQEQVDSRMFKFELPNSSCEATKKKSNRAGQKWALTLSCWLKRVSLGKLSRTDAWEQRRLDNPTPWAWKCLPWKSKLRQNKQTQK